MFDSLATPWTGAQEALLFMGFPRQESWSGLPFLSPRDLPDPGIEPASSALAGGSFSAEPSGKPVNISCCHRVPVERGEVATVTSIPEQPRLVGPVPQAQFCVFYKQAFL